MPIKVTDLLSEEYAPFYATYVNAVPPELPLSGAFDDSLARLLNWLGALPAARHHYAYGPGKWTVAQALQHIIDTERIFAYRALRIGRGDKTPLPGFDQDAYAKTAGGKPAFDPMLDELRAVRTGTKALFASLSPKALLEIGTASGAPMSTRAMGFIIAGHMYHHIAVYAERYGPTA